MQRQVLIWPNKVLRTQSKLVTSFDENLKALVQDCWDTMAAYHGVGLSAVQIGRPLAVAVIDCGERAKDIPRFTMCNPRIIGTNGTQDYEEGCLSLPGEVVDTKRALDVLVEYQDMDGLQTSQVFKGFSAIVVQHEIDHMLGVTLADNLSPLKRGIIKKRLTKLLSPARQAMR